MVHLDEGGKGRGSSRLVDPAAPLTQWVEHFSVEGDRSVPQDRPWRVVPDPSPHVIFTVSSDSARCCVVGARTVFHDVHAGHRSVTIAARMRPGALGPLTGFRPEIFTDRGVPLEDV